MTRSRPGPPVQVATPRLACRAFGPYRGNDPAHDIAGSPFSETTPMGRPPPRRHRWATPAEGDLWTRPEGSAGARHDRPMDPELLARRQHGVISRAQALQAGLTDKAIRCRLYSQRWRPIHRGVYQTHSGETTWLARASAAVL